FAVNAVCFTLGAILVTRGVIHVTKAEVCTTEERHLRGAIVEGFSWVMGNPPMRTLALTIVAFNVTYGAAWGVFVLYTSDRLGMGAAGVGLRTSAAGSGGR